MLALWAALVFAAPPAAPTVTLVVERGASAAACPSDGELTAAVVRRLGRDPFVSSAARTARVRFERVGARGGFAAVITLVEADGRQGARRLEDPSCAALAETVALVLALAIDPLGGSVPPKVALRAFDPEERGLRREDPEPPPARPPARPGQPRERLRWHFAPSVLLALGAAPSVLLGPAVRVELAGPRWRAALGAAFLFSPPSQVDVTEVGVVRLEVRASGCWRADPWSVCGDLAYAHWIASADEGLAKPVSAAREALGVGVHVGVDLTAFARIELGFDVPITERSGFVLGGRSVWRGWPVTPSIGLVVVL